MEIQKINSSVQFNNKYKDFLKENYYGLAINNEKVADYLDNRFQEFIKIPGFKYTQIKSKFGMCRFYAENLGSNQINEVESEINKILSENGK